MAIEVAAAVIQRPDGAFLLARRPAGKVYAGYWEFPGGKIEAGEPVERALARELHEELDIRVEEAYRWITRRFSYPHGTVHLHFYRVVRWQGEPDPREGQAIAWQKPDGVMAVPMLPANAPVLASLRLPWLYAITQATQLGVPQMLARLEAKLKDGLRLLQVRELGLDPADHALFLRQVLDLAHRYGCRVMIKPPASGADGVHLTASQLMQIRARPAADLVAASCHCEEELQQAMRLELDFAVLGPVKATPSHPARAPLGWERFNKMIHGASIPIYAIGGLRASDLRAAWRAGAHGVAMIRGAWS